MRMALVGAGKMGRALRVEAEARGHQIALMVGGTDNRDGEALAPGRLRGVDVALEFTRPDAAPANLERLIEAGIPTVTGTTGWLDHLARISDLVAARDGALLHAANFSVGVQVLLRAGRALARGLRGRDGFDGVLLEWHHREKRDAPSGTAAVLREALRAEDAGREWPITSLRVGSIPGTHAVEVDGRHESLSLVHRVRDRAVFAEGAVTAAEWLVGRRGIFTFADLFGGDA